MAGGDGGHHLGRFGGPGRKKGDLSKSSAAIRQDVGHGKANVPQNRICETADRPSVQEPRRAPQNEPMAYRGRRGLGGNDEPGARQRMNTIKRNRPRAWMPIFSASGPSLEIARRSLEEAEDKEQHAG